MATYKRAQLFEIAHAAGHRSPAVYETKGGRFFCTCSCGWGSTTRPTFVDALGGGVHHVLTEAKVITGYTRSGISLKHAISRYLAQEHTWTHAGGVGELVAS